MFKESGTHIHQKIKTKLDSGYQGFKNIHSNTELPRKNTKLNPLSKEDKAYNKALSSKRIIVENVIGKLKRFKIIKERYRNRRKRFFLRINLIAGIYNYEL